MKIYLIVMMSMIFFASHAQNSPLEIDTTQIFALVDESATPKGGMTSFYRFVGEQLRYPADARRNGVEGKVFVEFVVNTNGKVSNVKVVRRLGSGCDEEALRVVSISPDWIPAKLSGTAVKQKLVIPVMFKLGKGK
jgi:protein TonB